MISGDPHHNKKPHGVLDKISNKISAIKEDITESVRDRSSSSSSDRRASISSSISSGGVSLPGDPLTIQDETRRSRKISGDGGSSASVTTPAALTNLTPNRHVYSIDQLALNMGFGGRANALPTSASSSVLTNSAAALPSAPVMSYSDLQHKFASDDDSILSRENSNDVTSDSKEYVINKVDPVEMISTPTTITVPKDGVRRSAMLLAGPKFRLNTAEPKKKTLNINNDTIFPVSIVVGVVSLVITLWKPISTYLSGFTVGFLFAATIVYILIRMYLNTLADENVVEEWIDFPALESMLEKVDKEDKVTNLHVSGATVTFQRYDADRDDDFVRYPCDIRLDGYRLIIKMASKAWNDEKKSEKEVKFIGYREYLVKEAKLILVPEATLTRAKYWMNDFPIVIQDLQILDKQILNKQHMEKSKLDTNDFFNNNSTILSIWLETGPQKEEWFHKLSLILRKGKEEIERANSLIAGGNISPSSPPMNTSSLNYRAAQNERDTELSPGPVSEAEIRTAILDTQSSVQELQQKAQIKDSTSGDKDASGTHRTAVRKSKKRTPNEVSLYNVLQTPECLDEAAITINFMTRRLLCDMFEVSFFKDMLKAKIEMKMKEVAVSILENLRVISIDMGNTFPVILKIEPMQWNTNGIWFNLFIFYRGSFKLSVKTRVVLQKLLNYDPKRDKPMFAQHHSAQIVHKDEEHIDEDDLMQRQKLLAKEPEIPEMAVARKLGLALTNLATNKYFQWFANLPFITRLFEKLSEEEAGADVEVTSFSGLLTLNIPPPPSDRIWVGFPEMPDLNIKVTPTYGNKQYSYKLLQDFLEAKVRAELKRLIVLPAMDDQLLPLFRDWAIDVIGEIVSKPVNPLTDNYKAKLNAQASVREGLQEYKDAEDLNKPGLKGSASSSSMDTYL